MRFTMSNQKVVDMLRGADLPKLASTIKGRGMERTGQSGHFIMG